MSTLTSLDELYFGGSAPEIAVPMLDHPAQAIAGESLSDHALLAATCAGDEAAFAELVSRYRNQKH